jgi:hypothetical protein
VNQAGLAALPPDFPAFVREPANAARVAFLAGEPDRWRNTSDLPVKHYNVVDHYLDLEELAAAGLDATTLPPLRYVFATRFAAGRAAHPQNFSPIDPQKNADHSREWPGFAPWAITEYYGKLKSAFSYLKAFEEAGTPEEAANARASIVYLMGLMGHYVGDCAQPLHTTVHFNGWVGDNPRGYTTWPGFHSWIDGGFIAKAGITFADVEPRVRPAAPLALAPRADGRDPVFVAVVDYVLAQHELVEPLYRLEQEGKFSDALEHEGKYRQDARPVNAEGRAFIADRLLTGGQMLAALWVTAWKQAGPDVYLRAQLLRRKSAP